jgi:hypothetical protein
LGEHVLPADADLSLRGFDQPVEEFQEGGFARAAFPDQGHGLPGRDRETDAPEGFHAR